MHFLLSDRAGYREIHSVREDVEKAHGEEVAHIAAKMAFNAQAREAVFQLYPYLHDGCVSLDLYKIYMGWRHDEHEIEEAFGVLVDEGLLVQAS